MTAELLPITTRPLDSRSNVQTVNARDLHHFLQVASAFSDWLSRRVKDYGFSQDVDYVRSFLSVDAGGTGRHECYLTLDMAKQLAMMERNDRGREIRRYFIECERRQLEASTFTLPKTLSQALRIAADQAEQIEAQQALIAEQAPKAEFVDRYVAATGNKGFREVAKLINANEAEFRTFLLGDENRKGCMYRLAHVMTPYQTHIDAGRFAIKAGIAGTEHAYNQAKFTPRGVTWIAGEWAKYQLTREREHEPA